MGNTKNLTAKTQVTSLESECFEKVEERFYAGDIWTNLPPHQVLSDVPFAGLVISPPCDILLEGKTGSVTMLPIVSMDIYFKSRLFVDEIKKKLTKLIPTIKKLAPNIAVSNDSLESKDFLQGLKDILDGISQSKKSGQQKQLECAITLLLQPPKCPEDTVKLVSDFLLSGYNELIDNLMAHKDDGLHLLPYMPNSSNYCPILVLYKYPYSVPIELLKFASNSDLQNWSSIVLSRKSEYPIYSDCTDRPVRQYRITYRHYAGVISRFIMYYSRLGSPLIHDETITKINGAICYVPTNK